MRQQVVLAFTAFALTAGSIFSFANVGISKPFSKDCSKFCSPFCCADTDDCDPEDCYFMGSGCLVK